MSDTSFTYYRTWVYHIYPDATSVYTPSVRGAKNCLYFADTPTGQYAVKFSSHELAQKNLVASKLMRSAGVSVPDIRIGEMGGHWYETYPIIPGKTLYEHIKDGMPDSEIRKTYHKILGEFAKMDTIAIDSIHPDTVPLSHIHQVVYHGFCGYTYAWVAITARCLIYLMNLGRRRSQGIYHFDIGPKNILIGPNQTITFLDLDGVAICNRNVVLGLTFSRCLPYHIPPQVLLNSLNTHSDKPCNRTHIMAMFYLHSLVRILWKYLKYHR